MCKAIVAGEPFRAKSRKTICKLLLTVFGKVQFRKRRFDFTVGNVTEKQARAKAIEGDDTLTLIEHSRLELPPGVRLEEFVAAGGKVPVVSARPEAFTARQLSTTTSP